VIEYSLAGARRVARPEQDAKSVERRPIATPITSMFWACHPNNDPWASIVYASESELRGNEAVAAAWEPPVKIRGRVCAGIFAGTRRLEAAATL